MSVSTDKQASAPLPYPQREANKMDAAKFMVGVPLAALAIGALARGGLGLRDMFTAHKLPSPALLGQTQFIGMPHVRKEEEEKGQTVPYRRKFAADEGMLSAAARKLVYEPFMQSGAGENNWFSGDSAHSIAAVPMSGLAMPLGLAGLYGGWKATDALLDSRRRAEQDASLAKAKAQYMQALQGSKTAQSAADVLDKLAEEKTANPAMPAAAPALPSVPTKPGFVDHVPYIGGQASGMYGSLALAAMLATALGTGKMSYDFFNSQSKRKTLDEALKRRAANNSDSTAPVFAYTE